MLLSLRSNQIAYICAQIGALSGHRAGAFGASPGANDRPNLVWPGMDVVVGTLSHADADALLWASDCRRDPSCPKAMAGSRAGTSSGRALHLLDERYARGEIEREEYLRRRQDILGR